MSKRKTFQRMKYVAWSVLLTAPHAGRPLKQKQHWLIRCTRHFGSGARLRASVQRHCSAPIKAELTFDGVHPRLQKLSSTIAATTRRGESVLVRRDPCM